MFTVRVYKICIASAGGTLQEVRVAQDSVINRNGQQGEDRGVVF